MRELLGIADDDPRLPGPHDPQPLTEPGGEVLVYQRPDWKAGLKDESNRAVRLPDLSCFATLSRLTPFTGRFCSQWIESIAQQVVEDGWKVSRAASTSADFDSKTRIPDEDLEFDVAFKAAKTSFNNFAKKWASQNDPVAIEKAIVNAKKGRRWARKDLVRPFRTLHARAQVEVLTIRRRFPYYRSRRSAPRRLSIRATLLCTPRIQPRISSSSTTCHPSTPRKGTTLDWWEGDWSLGYGRRSVGGIQTRR